MEGGVGPALAAALERRRDRYNAAFAQARHLRPRLSGPALLDFLRVALDPIAAAVDRAAPGRVDEVVEVCYDLALELVGTELTGRWPAIAEGWRRLLPALASQLAGQPRRLAPRLTNALFNLEGRAFAWIEEMLRLGPGIEDPDLLLSAGQVLAWRCGLPHYRESALDLCQELPGPLCARALGLEQPPGIERLRELKADPWMRPGGERPRSLQVAHRLGGFRGYGGPFLAPPSVRCGGGNQFFLTDGEGSWLLCADCFGVSLTPSALPPDGPYDPVRQDFSVDAKGRVTCGAARAELPELAGAASQAAGPFTLAVTRALSHHVWLIPAV